MQLGLGKKGEAIAIYNVDQPVPATLLEELSKLPNIISVKQVSL